MIIWSHLLTRVSQPFLVPRTYSKNYFIYFDLTDVTKIWIEGIVFRRIFSNVEMKNVTKKF
jgi:hypothetical protein